MSPVPRIHVFGMGGVIGRTLYEASKLSHQNWSFSHRAKNFDGVEQTNISTLDISKSMDSRFFENHDIFIFATGQAAAVSGPQLKEYNESEIRLIHELATRNKKVIYFSSSRVAQYFEQGPFSIPSTLIPYVIHKAEVESILASYAKGVTVRLGKVVHAHFNYFANWLPNLILGKKIEVSSGIYTEPIFNRDVVQTVQAIVNSNSVGIFEMWAFDSINYLEIATLFINSVYPKLNPSEVLVDTGAIWNGVARPPNTTLITEEHKSSKWLSKGAILNALEAFIKTNTLSQI